MSYSVQNIRNVCLLGHSGSGKTALAESLLLMTGAIDRMGRAADGNTVCDYDQEEIKRQISLSTAIAPLEYKGCRINLLDTPGAFDFAGEVMEALRAADAAPAALSIDWGDGVLYDRSRVWAEQRELVADGLLRPELALAWYYGLPHETETDLRRIRERMMPKGGNT